MKKVVPVLIIVIVALIVAPAINSTASGQDVQPAPKLFIGGGALPETMYKEFRKLTGPDANIQINYTFLNRFDTSNLITFILFYNPCTAAVWPPRPTRHEPRLPPLPVIYE